MSRFTRLFGLASRAPTILRTVAHLRSSQLFAQVAHLVHGNAAPQRLDGWTPNRVVPRVATAFCPPPAHVDLGPARDDAARPLTLLRRPLDVAPGAVPWTTDEHGPLFAYHLHEQAWLRHPSLPPETRAAFVADWIAAHREGVGWNPHPISLRLLAWGKLLLTPDAITLSEADAKAVAASMAEQAETLAAGLEVRLQANHLLSNLLGVVWAGLLFEGPRADGWRDHVDLLRTELARQVRRDGAHEERSPMYHGLILENLLDLLNLAQASPRTPAGLVDVLVETTRRMCDALALWTGPDGRIALFADAAWGVAQAPAVLFDYARRLGVLERAPDASTLAFSDADYVRLDSDDFAVIQSVGPPSPAHQPGHAHGDGLAFTCWVDGRLLVTDTGVFEYRPGARRDLARATANHATLAFDGEEQSEFWSAHRVGGRARRHDLEVGTNEVRASMQGFARGAPIHERVLRLADTGLEIEDTVRQAGRRAESRLPLAPEWSAESEGDTILATHAETGARVRFHFEGTLGWTVERAPFYPTFHHEVDRPVLTAQGATPLTTRIRIEKLAPLSD